MTKNFTLINCTPSTNSLNETVFYNITYSFTDEWNDKQVCSANCYLHTDAFSNGKFLYTQTFKVKDKNGKWNARLAKHLIYTDDYNKNVSKHIKFLERTLTKEGVIKK